VIGIRQFQCGRSHKKEARGEISVSFVTNPSGYSHVIYIQVVEGVGRVIVVLPAREQMRRYSPSRKTLR
jgi:hypothetical protein